MDRATLTAHRHRWVTESHPTAADLTRLNDDELDLYTSLVADDLGDRVRLEQELVDWQWAQERLIAGGTG